MARQCINIIQSWHQNLEITLLIYDKVCYKNGHKEGLSTESRISSDIELIFCLFTKRLYRSVIVVFSSIIYTKKERKKTQQMRVWASSQKSLNANCPVNGHQKKQPNVQLGSNTCSLHSSWKFACKKR